MTTRLVFTWLRVRRNTKQQQQQALHFAAAMAPLNAVVPSGVVTGDDCLALFEYARANSFAIPAVNCTSSSTANAALEAARRAGSPIIIECTHKEAAFFLGEGLADGLGPNAAVAGAVALATHVRSVAKYYGVPVVLHSDHCQRRLLPWFDGMLAADEAYFERHGEPLFSSHMLDLSEESDEDNVAVCVEYFERMARMKLWLEVEIGVTGGDEDGDEDGDDGEVDPDTLYTSPERVFKLHEALSRIGPMFSIAAAFGNVHGVYKPGNVVLSPERLGEHQRYAKERSKSSLEKPIYLVMHGGSGSTDEEIDTAVSHGVVKMNVNTDTQWAYWDGLRQYEATHRDFLQGQIGNPNGEDEPNKKYYEPRAWVRQAEASMRDRVGRVISRLGGAGTYEPTDSSEGYCMIGDLAAIPRTAP